MSARAIACRASTRWWTSATGARSSSSCRTASTTSRRCSRRSSCGSGTEGESYPGIRKDVVNVADRLTLADQAGPFGNPTSDSARTMVTEATSTRPGGRLCSRRDPTGAAGQRARGHRAASDPVCRRSADPPRRHIISGCDACGGRRGGRRAGHAPWHAGAQAVPRAGRTVAARTQRDARCWPRRSIRQVVVALPAEYLADLPPYLRDARVRVVEGGPRRQDSVANAVHAVSAEADVVLIHDAARPFVDLATIERVIEAAAAAGAAIAALPARRHGEAGRHHRDVVGGHRVRRAAAGGSAQVGAGGEADAARARRSSWRRRPRASGATS